MHDAQPTGEDMSMQTLLDVLEFVRIVALGKDVPMLVQVSGGEPTLHPQIYDVVNAINSTLKKSVILIESNGSFVFDERRKRMVREVLNVKNVYMQVRTHPVYYPNYHKIINNTELRTMKKTSVYEDSIYVFPFGRAKSIKSERQYRSCANLFRLHKQLPELSLARITSLLHAHRRYCIPMIDPHGVLHAGESMDCVELGHVARIRRWDEIPDCGKCGLNE
jgi:organic radical activating enzyme